MLELIFVIIILGIIASIASELIAKVYESYILQRAQYKANMKTELAAKQIAEAKKLTRWANQARKEAIIAMEQVAAEKRAVEHNKAKIRYAELRIKKLIHEKKLDKNILEELK